MPSRRTAGTIVLGVLMFGGAASIALRDRPFRHPQSVIVSTPEVRELQNSNSRPGNAASGEQQDAASETDTTPAPSIVHVAPKDGASDNVIIIRDPATIGQDFRMAHVPDRRLIEQSDHGPLPRRGEDGRRPFDVYARNWSGTRGARVAILIGGLGLSQTGTQKAIAALPSTVTLAFAPQGNSIGRWMQTARRQGHEIMMQIPLEPFGYPQVNPGRNTLISEDTPADNLDRLHWVLGRTTNYTGVVNYMGGRFLTDKTAMDPIMQDLANRGLLFLDDGSAARSVAADLALQKGTPFASADFAIDTEQSRGAILKKLDELERTARAKGFALGTGSAFNATISAVTSWIQEANKRGIEIVPVSALASDPERK